jgi:hypothetical protein
MDKDVQKEWQYNSNISTKIFDAEAKFTQNCSNSNYVQ